ncbi:MAG: class I SAM-dependent methyltransferase [Gammaproteobacteria bacterium]|jgi:cyclopropane-fatty-acyl-phospholipid synthase|nr:class I SAM-dependent methyltransferase [Gammaproteobacteria bacterium]MBT5826013.1 class I SAM-dependent methyltransferase [Gammaproteobacteria bacterium]MBT5967132.1 class I SAM-dependent methyltransferase [Gammaproteobacteria bacterium]MBT6420978.1 class I SAM-dependent methyltransferase [Gammaproteobacteria bacterium]MBT6576242.1 class I SAM-dependent methyltransferase [Gammaproteobacteria bacterium]
MNASVESLTPQSSRLDLFLRRSLLDKLANIEQAQISITDPLGYYELGSGSDEDLHAEIIVADLSFYRKLALGGSIGAAEAYMDKLWEADDLTKVIQIMVRNRDLLDSMEGGLASLANKLLTFWHRRNQNTAEGSRRNIAAHYDLGNDFFALFLDKHGMYSSGTYYLPDMSLEEASEAKLERICQKLDLKTTDHLIEIGTGWGGFAAYAAKNFGCKITTTTISAEQFNAAEQRMLREGVADKVTVVMQDYRDLQGQYDKLVSIEMIEAVGHQFLDTYLAKCASLLKADGLALIQAITIEDQRYQQALKNVDFIQRYIFPGSFIPSVSAIVNSSAKQSDLRLISLEDQGESYALTLNHWRQRFTKKLDEIRLQGFSEEFIRMWVFYLCYCEGGFLEKSTSSVQVLFAKPQNRRAQWL